MNNRAYSPSGGVPLYLPQGDECEIFESVFRRRLALLLKGPSPSLSNFAPLPTPVGR